MIGVKIVKGIANTRTKIGISAKFKATVTKFMEHTRAPLFRLAARLLGNAADAEDVLQQSYLKAFRAIGGFRIEADFGTWLHRIVVNSCHDHLRRRVRLA